jgi:hypothetical protein
VAAPATGDTFILFALEAFVMTTGSRGFDLVAPLELARARCQVLVSIPVYRLGMRCGGGRYSDYRSVHSAR